MEDLIIYRDTRIPELRQIIGSLPNHTILRDRVDLLEEAINHYIDVVAPGGSPVPMEPRNNGANRGRSPSFVGVNVDYDPEAAMWGGRRRSKRSKRSKRSTRR